MTARRGDTRVLTVNSRNGHGTHVAGTAAATANNGLGIAGVAFNSPLAICKLDGAVDDLAPAGRDPQTA